jgi:hypothetical protein
MWDRVLIYGKKKNKFFFVTFNLGKKNKVYQNHLQFSFLVFLDFIIYSSLKLLLILLKKKLLYIFIYLWDKKNYLEKFQLK